MRRSLPLATVTPLRSTELQKYRYRDFLIACLWHAPLNYAKFAATTWARTWEGKIKCSVSAADGRRTDSVLGS